jgi:hypothetical protein
MREVFRGAWFVDRHLYKRVLKAFPKEGDSRKRFDNWRNQDWLLPEYKALSGAFKEGRQFEDVANTEVESQLAPGSVT